MTKGTSTIPWLIHNPWNLSPRGWDLSVGCSRCSAGCEHCYAATVAWIRSHQKNPKISDKYKGTIQKVDGKIDWTGGVNWESDKLKAPLKWKPSMIFICSHSDLFHVNIDYSYVSAVMKMIELCPQHIFVMVTKRSMRMAYYFNNRYKKPLPANLWPMVTVCNQEEADQKIPQLLSIDAKVHGISAEPLLGPLELWDYIGAEGMEGQNRLGWTIIGTESGPKRRPAEMVWLENLALQCSGYVPTFIKQAEIAGKVVKMPEIAGQVYDQYPNDTRITTEES